MQSIISSKPLENAKDKDANEVSQTKLLVRSLSFPMRLEEATMTREDEKLSLK